MAVTKVSFSKIPELLIYHPKGSNNYKMFSTKTGNSIGELSIEVRKDLFISKLLFCSKKATLREHRRVFRTIQTEGYLKLKKVGHINY